jgi:hypothetical protein
MEMSKLIDLDSLLPADREIVELAIANAESTRIERCKALRAEFVQRCMDEGLKFTDVYHDGKSWSRTKKKTEQAPAAASEPVSATQH